MTPLELERAALIDLIKRLKSRSYARIVAEAELRRLTHHALQHPTHPSEPSRP